MKVEVNGIPVGPIGKALLEAGYRGADKTLSRVRKQEIRKLEYLLSELEVKGRVGNLSGKDIPRLKRKLNRLQRASAN